MRKTVAFCFLFAVLFVFPSYVHLFSFETTEYVFRQDPIDVVIPCGGKDIHTLDLCIAGIKKNCEGVGRVFVVSERRYTDKAEWIAESSFPFDKDSIAFELFGNHEMAAEYKANPNNRLGWIHQQLLKFYSPFVIKGVSSNVLILDADTIFLRPVSFIGKNGAACFNPGSEYHAPYFVHMKRLLPDLHRVHTSLSGISHHMLFQECVLTDLKSRIEEYHTEPMWKALVHCIDHTQLFGSSMSEYEIYFTFALLRCNQFTIRNLVWANIKFSTLDQYAQGYDYVAAHSYMG